MAKKKTSLIMMEASAKAVEQETNDKGISSVSKHIVKFAKSGYKDYFEDDDMIYVNFVTQHSGQLKVKAHFPNNHGGFGPIDLNEVEK